MPNDALMKLALLERGDTEALLAFQREHFGNATMTSPTPPAGDTIVVPVAPPTPAPTPPAPAPSLQTFTAEDIERARQQEKDKLYERLEQEAAERKKLEEQMKAFTADLTTRQQAEEAALKAAADAAEEKRLAELSFGEKLAEFQTAQDAKMQSLQQALEQRDAVIEKEREFHNLMQYRDQALQTEVGQQILPELRDLVAGNTQAEIDASLSALATRSASILEQVAQATGAARQGARGVGVTAPPVGPLDNNSGYESVSVDDIRGMDMQTYAQNRGRLLGAASQQHRDRGMFG